MDRLLNEGYVLYESCVNVNDADIIVYDKESDQTDVASIKRFIDTRMLPDIAYRLGINSRIDYVKFRFSDHGNLTDAATFHSDVYNYTDEYMPIYTCLCYLDDAEMELIPRSHLCENRAVGGCNKCYADRIRVRIPAHSLLVFNSAIFHRGVSRPQDSRRLLQVFDCTFDKQSYDLKCKKLTTLDTTGPITDKLFSLIPSVSEDGAGAGAFLYMHYVLVYHHLQYKVYGLDLPPWQKRDCYVTYEPGRHTYYKPGWLSSNVNVVCDPKCKRQGTSRFYTVVLLVVLLGAAHLYFRGGKTKTKTKR